MNCKPGDLALVVRSSAGNEGAIVTVIKFLGHIPGWLGNDRWEIDRQLQGVYLFTGMPSSHVNHMRDSYLRPIRDQPGNESFVTESRKSLPRPATAKGDTIDARGEVHS